MFFSKGETISDLSKIVMRAGMEELRPIFEVCGYACSDNLTNCQLSHSSLTI